MISDSKLLASAAWDAQSLNELKAKAGEDPAANIRPVARQVEGMFVQMMLKSMRDALPKDGLFSSEHTRLYTSMYDQQIAQQMTAGKGLGLAEMMVKQMTPEQPLPEESTPAAPMKFPLETVVRYQNQALSQLVQKAVPRIRRISFLCSSDKSVRFRDASHCARITLTGVRSSWETSDVNCRSLRNACSRLSSIPSNVPAS